jgi:hypothetical protein
MRENQRLFSWLPVGAAESVRKQIDALTAPRPRTPTSVDLPLSKASKRALCYAAEEADRLNHRHIGCEHLLLGLLREPGSVAAKILEQFGAKLDPLREKFEKTIENDLSPAARVLPPSDQGRPERSTNLIKLRNAFWDADYVREAVIRCCERKFYWRKAASKLRDAVVERKTGKISLDLTLSEDSATFDLVKGGWTKDHCAICRWELFESNEDSDHGTGYTNGRDWVCSECYDKFWERPNFISSSYSEIT